MTVKAQSRLAIRWAVLASALIAFGLAISGCNTVRGVGEDVSAAGQGLADVASDMSN